MAAVSCTKYVNVILAESCRMSCAFPVLSYSVLPSRYDCTHFHHIAKVHQSIIKRCEWRSRMNNRRQEEDIDRA